jgi:hypothetical protein
VAQNFAIINQSAGWPQKRRHQIQPLSDHAVIRVYDAAGNVIETPEQAVASSGDFWFHR